MATGDAITAMITCAGRTITLDIAKNTVITPVVAYIIACTARFNNSLCARAGRLARQRVSEPCGVID